MLRNRQELQNTTSISRVLNKTDKESVAIVGLVSSIRETKNKNILLSIEDSTGKINVLVNKNKADVYNLTKNLVLDEVIGVVGVNTQKIIFANNIILPDIPFYKELKKSPDEEYAIFLSDIHVGSTYFLEHEFNRFLDWLNCEVGTDKQKELVSKIKYVFIVGDLVDGVGIYPGQDTELTLKDIYKQYDVCAELLKRIPERIQVIICPGNHDALRIAEPQPPLPKEFCEKLYTLPNFTLVSNPAQVKIGKTEEFSGFDVLLYHGYSFDYYISNVAEIRNNGGYDRADLVMKFLLQRRHLSPTHTATLYIPDHEEDPLIINKIPDFFVTGHIHKTSVSNYRNITMVCGSCWQAKTPFQEKVGHHPEPCKVPLVNLKTRDIKILKFG